MKDLQFNIVDEIILPKVVLRHFGSYEKAAVLITLVAISKKKQHDAFGVYLFKAPTGASIADFLSLSSSQLRTCLEAIANKEGTLFFSRRKDVTNRTFFKVNWQHFENVFGTEDGFVAACKRTDTQWLQY